MGEIEQTLREVDVPQNAVALFWFGQNSFAIKDPAGSVILTDPYFPLERPADKFIHPERPVDETRLHADAALLTHDHGDHTCVESLRRLRECNPKMECVGPPESVTRLKAEGFSDEGLREIVAGATLQTAGVTVHAVLSKLPGGSPQRDIAPSDCIHLGFVLETAGGRIYVTGDAQNDLAEVDALMDPVTALKPEIGLITTHPTEGEFPFFDGAVKCARRIGLKIAVPAHYHCFVKRTYDPVEWAKSFPGDSPTRLIIPYKGYVILSVSEGWFRYGG